MEGGLQKWQDLHGRVGDVAIFGMQRPSMYVGCRSIKLVRVGQALKCLDLLYSRVSAAENTWKVENNSIYDMAAAGQSWQVRAELRGWKCTPST